MLALIIVFSLLLSIFLFLLKKEISKINKVLKVNKNKPIEDIELPSIPEKKEDIDCNLILTNFSLVKDINMVKEGLYKITIDSSIQNGVKGYIPNIHELYMEIGNSYLLLTSKLILSDEEKDNLNSIRLIKDNLYQAQNNNDHLLLRGNSTTTISYDGVNTLEFKMYNYYGYRSSMGYMSLFNRTFGEYDVNIININKGLLSILNSIVYKNYKNSSNSLFNELYDDICDTFIDLKDLSHSNTYDIKERRLTFNINGIIITNDENKILYNDTFIECSKYISDCVYRVKLISDYMFDLYVTYKKDYIIVNIVNNYEKVSKIELFG